MQNSAGQLKVIQRSWSYTRCSTHWVSICYFHHLVT